MDQNETNSINTIQILDDCLSLVSTNRGFSFCGDAADTKERLVRHARAIEFLQDLKSKIEEQGE